MDINYLEIQLKEYKELSKHIRELEERRKELGKNLLQNFPCPANKYQTPNFRVSRHQRVSIKTPLEQARIFNATKFEENIDKEKLKALYSTGTSVPGITTTEYIMINPVKKESTQPT
jgi:hypothetical protein